VPHYIVSGGAEVAPVRVFASQKHLKRYYTPVRVCAGLCMFVFAFVPQNMATAGLPPLTQRPQVDLRNKGSFE
jgi:hypothetical protein